MSDKPTYKSHNQKNIKKKLTDLLDQKSYRYDASNDRVYSDYTTNSRENARKAALQTRLYGNAVNNGDAYSDRVSNQAFHRYTSTLNDRVPELAELDFQKYQANRQKDYTAMNAIQQKEKTEYGRYRDDVAQWEKDRQLELKKQIWAKQQAEKAAAAAQKQAAADAKAAEKAAKAAKKSSGGRKKSGTTATTPEVDTRIDQVPINNPNFYPKGWNPNGPLVETTAEKNARFGNKTNESPLAFSSPESMIDYLEYDKKNKYGMTGKSQEEKLDEYNRGLEARSKGYKAMEETRKKQTEQQAQKTYGVSLDQLSDETEIDKAIEQREKDIDTLDQKIAAEEQKNVAGFSAYADGGQQTKSGADEKKVKYYNAEKDRLDGQRVMLERAKAEVHQEDIRSKYDGMSSDQIRDAISKDYSTEEIDKKLMVTRDPDERKNLRLERDQIRNDEAYAKRVLVDARVKEDTDFIENNPDIAEMMHTIDDIDQNSMGTNFQNNAINSVVHRLNEMGYDGKRLVDSYKRNQNAQLKEQRIADAEKFAEDHPILASGASNVYNIQNQLQGAANAVSGAFNALGSGEYPVDYNDDTNINRGSIMRNVVSEKINDILPGYAGKALEMGYQGVESAIDSALSVGLYGEATTAMFAVSAADDAYAEGIEKGLSQDDALTSAILSGAWEYVFETVELESLESFAKMGAKSKAQFITNALKQAANEGTGEAMTDIFNNMSDQAINGYSSKFYDNVVNYMNQGMSFDEAKQNASKDMGLEIAQDFAVGGISGGLMGSSASAIGNVTNNISERVQDSTEAKMIAQDKESTQALIETGLSTDKESTAAKLAEKLQEKVDAGQQVTAKEVKNLRKANEQALASESMTAVETVLDESTPETAKKGIEKAILSGKVTDSQAVAILKNDSAREAFSGVTGVQIDSTDSVQTVKEAAQLARGQQFDGKAAVTDKLNGIKAERTLTDSEIEGAKTVFEGDHESIAGAEGSVYGRSVKIGDVSIKDGHAVVQVSDGQSVHEIPLYGLETDPNSVAGKIVNAASSLGEHGKVNFLRSYDGDIQLDVFQKGYTEFYNAGLYSNGNADAFNAPMSVYADMLTDRQQKEAFYAGQNDAKQDLEQRKERASKAQKRSGNGPEIKSEVKISDTERNALQAISDITGRQVTITDATGIAKVLGISKADAEGSYGVIVNGSIYVNQDAGHTAMQVLAHEITHYGKNAAPESYEEYKNAVLEEFQKNRPDEYREMYDRYSSSYSELTQDEILEEMVADATQALIENPEAFRAAIQENITFGEKIVKFLNDFLDWIDDLIGNHNLDNEAAEFLADDVEAFRKAARAYAKMVEEAGGVDLYADTKTETKTETKADTKAEVKAEVKTEAKAEVKTEAKAEVKAEAKTEVKEESKTKRAEVDSKVIKDIQEKYGLSKTKTHYMTADGTYIAGKTIDVARGIYDSSDGLNSGWAAAGGVEWDGGHGFGLSSLTDAQAGALLKNFNGIKNPSFSIYDSTGKYVGTFDYTGKMSQSIIDDLKSKIDSKNFADIRKSKNTNVENLIENGDIRHSIRTNEHGVNYINIDIDQDLFDEFDIDDIRKIAQMYIIDYFSGGKTIGYKNGEKVYTSNSAARKYTKVKGAKRIPSDIRNAKYRVATELDNLLNISSFISHEPDYNGHHPEAVGGYDYYLAIVRFGDKYYSGVINIMNEEGGQKFYDFSRIKALDGGGTLNINKSYLALLSKAYAESIHKDALNYKPVNAKKRLFAVDTEGKTLSEQQQAYFKDSKKVDSDGRLMVMYHGTSGDFTEFDPQKAKASGTFGRGFYFSSSKGHAGQYGKTFEVYLNMVNPVSSVNETHDITRSQLRDFIQALADDEDYGIDNYGYGATVESVLRDVYSKEKSDFSMLQDLNATCVGDMVSAVKLFNEVNGTDYDSIDTPMESVVFKPNQVKLTTNENPTGHSDTRFSLKIPVEESGDLIAVHNLNAQNLLKTLKLGGFPMPSIAVTKASLGHTNFGDITVMFRGDTVDPKSSKKNKVYGADAWTPTFPRMEYEANSEEARRIASEIGRYSDQLPSYIGDRLRDFVNGLQFSIDNYGGREGIIERALEHEGMKAAYLVSKGIPVESITKEVRKEFDEPTRVKAKALINALGEKNIIEGLSGDEVLERYGSDIKQALKNMFIARGWSEEKASNATAGQTVMQRGLLTHAYEAAVNQLKNDGYWVKEEVDYDAIEKFIDKNIDQEGFEKWVSDIFKDIEADRGIRNGKSLFTDSGNRRSFKQTHMPLTAENIVKSMLAVDDVRNVVGFQGAKTVRAVVAREFNSLNDIRKNADKLQHVSEDEFNEKQEELNIRLHDIIGRIVKNSDRGSYSNSMIDASEVGECILDVCRGKYTPQKFYDYLNKYHWKATMKDAQEIYDIAEEIKDMPVHMFEAKPQRVVGFDEIETVVLPEGTDTELIDMLDKNGIPYEFYEEGNEEERKQLINAHDKARFSKDTSEKTAVKSEEAGYDYDTNPELAASAAIAQDTLDLLEGFRVSDDQIRAMYDKYVKKNNSDIDYDEFEDKLKNIATYLNGTYRKNAYQVMQTLQDLSRQTMERGHGESDPDWEQAVRPAKEFLRNTRFVLSDAELKEVESIYGSFSELYKKIRGRLRVTTKANAIKNGMSESEAAALSIDGRWENIVDNYSQFLKMEDDLSPIQRLEYMAKLAYETPMDSYTNIYHDSLDGLSRSMANDMFMDLMSAITPPSASKKEKWNKYRTMMSEKNEAYRRDMEKKYQEKLAKYREMYKGKNDRLIQAMAMQSDKVRENEIARKERAERQKYKNDARKLYDRLNKMLESPTESAYVPKEMLSGVVEVLQEINFDSGFRNPDGSSTKAYEKLQQLQDMYTRLKQKDSTIITETGTEFDERIPAMLQVVRDMFEGGKNISDISNAQMRDLVETMSYIYESVKRSTQLIGKERNAKSYEYALRTIDDIKKSSGQMRGPLGYALNTYTNYTLSPERFMRRMVGYVDDDPMMALTRDLTRGEERVHQIEMEGEKILAPLFDSKNKKKLNEFTGKHAKKLDFGLVDTNGNPVYITPAMKCSIIMHSRNAANFKHMEKGGLAIPDFDLYTQGKIQQAFDQKHIVKGITMNTIKQLEGTLTDYEREFISTAMYFFDNYSKKIVNETSLQLNGYEKARVSNYFPIRTDSDFLKKPFESVSYDFSLENSGFLKSRQSGSGNPIMLEDVTDVINRQLSSVARYAGLAIPLSNFNKVMNVTLMDYEGSMKDAIRDKWKKPALDYIEHLISDLNGATERSEKDPVSKVLGAGRSGLAASVLTLNPSVTMKQAASYPTAAAVLGYAPLAKAMAQIPIQFGSYATTKKMVNAQYDLIDKYTAEHWYRRKGSASYGTDLDSLNSRFDIMSKVKSVPVLGALVNSIQEVDIGTTSLLWNASEYYVQDHFKNLEKGSDSYYRKVAEIYNKTIHDTQPNYSVMQRPGFLRTNNELSKAFTMFMTQRLQNGNILYDSTANLLAKQKSYAKEKSAENKTGLKQARVEFARGISSQLISAAVLSAMTLASRAMLHKMNAYRDDRDEITFESLRAQLFKDFMNSLAGSWMFGAEIYDFVESEVTGDKYYGINDNALSAISDLVDSFDTMINSFKKFDPDDPEGNKDMVQTQFVKVAGAAGQVLGIPVNNMLNIMNAVKLHAIDAMNDNLLGFEAGVNRTTKMLSDNLYDSYLENDELAIEEAYNTLIDAGKSPKQINSQIKSRLEDQDSRVTEAAQALIDLNYEKWEENYKAMLSDGYSPDVVTGAINKVKQDLEDNKEAEDVSYEHRTYEDITSDHEKKVYPEGYLDWAVQNRDLDRINEVKEDWTEVSTAKDPEKSVSDSVKASVKAAYADEYAERVLDGRSVKDLESYFKSVGISEDTYKGWAKDAASAKYKEEYANAWKTGDTYTIEKINSKLDGSGIDPKNWGGQSDLKKEFEAAYNAGDKTKMDRLLSAADELGISESDMWQQIGSEEYKPVGTALDSAINAYSDGNASALQSEINDYVKYYEGRGKTQKDAFKAMKGKITKEWKPKYIEGDQAQRNRIETILINYCGYDKKTISNWLK